MRLPYFGQPDAGNCCRNQGDCQARLIGSKGYSPRRLANISSSTSTERPSNESNGGFYTAQTGQNSQQNDCSSAPSTQAGPIYSFKQNQHLLAATQLSRVTCALE